jgi:branched-chain amino acid transport system substrate-binding protein
MPLPTLARPFALFTAMTGILLGGLACTTQVANGVSTGGGGGGGGGAGGHPECSKNADCAGDMAICNRARGKCANLLDERCNTIHGTTEGDWKNEDAVLFGSILPTGSSLDHSTGQIQENAIRLALDDLAKVGGLPSTSGAGKRPLFVVNCNDGPDEDRAVAAAKHLVDELGVPAIIGHSFSGATLQIATEITIPAGVVLFSPSATNPAISTLADNDLVWRSAPPDPFQATALASYLPTVEKALRARYGLAPSMPIRVAVVHNDDAYGASLADALEAKLSFNGASAQEQLGSNYRRFDYGPPGAPDGAIPAKVIDFAPHLTFLFGFEESLTALLAPIEAQWAAPDHRSFFVLGDAGEVSTLWNEVITTDDLRSRITGTVPGPLPAFYQPYGSFLLEWATSPYAASGEGDAFGVAGAYDALYLLAYSAVAVGADPLTGRKLVDLGLRAMTPKPGELSPKEVVGPQGISAVMTKMVAREHIDIEGASGPLDFDAHGDAPSDIQIWCVPKGSGGKVAGPAISAGVYYDVTSQAIAGSFSPDCALP